MFEVGKKYEFTFIREEMHGLSRHEECWSVQKIDGNLLHLNMPARSARALNDDDFLLLEGEDQPEKNMILNTGSVFFDSARPSE
ncbi:hypothetical protein [Falsirhodobacter sp. alg1]|uniref:hypothetical protein n=1 Tax=Falsirhodobacter sp. alg1 TaxID=1472418 RepID=UPI00078781C1|nr:hypothetical protein [Falsirhodobacter sp. alg1]